MLSAVVRRSLAVALVAILTWALPGVAQAQEPSPEPASPAQPDASAAPSTVQPEGDWIVPAFDAWGDGLAAPRPDTTLTLSFLDPGRIEGETGCGTYFGSYSLDGDALNLSVISKGPDPCSTAVNEEAVAYSVALDAVTGWRATASGLELLDESGTVRVVLERARGGDVGGDWIAERYWRANGSPEEPIAASPILLRFDADGRVSGSTGCRLLEGQYLRSGDQVIIAVETTGLPCEGDLRRQERRLLRALETVVLWQREGDRLLLTDGFGEPLLELRASASTAPREVAAPGDPTAPRETVAPGEPAAASDADG